MESTGADFALPEYLTCPVCEDVLKHPCILACSHTLCRQCLVDEHAKTGVSPNDVSPRGLVCPLCGDQSGVSTPDECPRNRAIADAVEHWHLRNIRRDECLQLLTSVAAAKDSIQQGKARRQDGNGEQQPSHQSYLPKSNNSQKVAARQRLKEPLETYARADDVCKMLQTLNSRHLEVLSIHCKYVDNLSNLQMHIQELLSLKFIAMRAMVKVNFADAMEPIELCRKSGLRLTKELSEHFKEAECLADSDVERFLQTDKVLAQTLQQFVDTSDSKTRAAVEDFKAHLYKTVIDMEAVKNALSSWKIRSSIPGEPDESRSDATSNKPDDVNVEDGCNEEGGEALCHQEHIGDGLTEMNTSSKEASPSSNESSTTEENAQHGFLHPQARFVEAQTHSMTDTSTQGANVAETTTQKNPEATEGKSSPDWEVEAPVWTTVKASAENDATDAQRANADSKQDPVQEISAGGRYFCPIVIPDCVTGPNDRQSYNVSDLECTTERDNPGDEVSTSTGTLLREEFPFDGMTLRTSADQEAGSEPRAARSSAPYNFADTLSNALSDSADTLEKDSDSKSSEDEWKWLSESRKKRTLSARDTRTILSPRLAETRRNPASSRLIVTSDNLKLSHLEASPSISSDEYLGPWGRRRNSRQHQGAGEPYIARPLPRYVPGEIRQSPVYPNCGSRSGLVRSLGRSHDTTFRIAEFQLISGERVTPPCSQVMPQTGIGCVF